MPLLSDRRLDRMNRAVLSGRIIPYFVGALASITILAALAVRVFARGEFTSFGESIWWAAQTITTVGYGDVIPKTPFSKGVAIVVMLFGVATASLTTAIITSSVISATQRRAQASDPHGDALEEIAERLQAVERIEDRLRSLERRLGGD